MSRILISLTPFPAHIFPVIPIAQRLRDRGHDVSCHTDASYGGLLAAAGLAFAAPRHAPGAEAAAIGSLRAAGVAVAAGEAVVRVLLAPAAAHVHDLDDIAAEFRPDVVVNDNARYGAAVFSALRGLPLATVNVTSFNWPDPDAPPYGPGLPLPRTARDRARYRALAASPNGVYGPRAAIERESLAAYNATRAAFGLAPLPGPLALAVLSPYLHILPTTEAFEYRRRNLPRQVHFVGPCLWDGAETNVPIPPWVYGLGRHRAAVYVTQGTADNRAYTLIGPAIGALAGEEIDVAVTVGLGHDPATLGPLPPNTCAAGFIPQSVLLPRVRAVVTNGGHGSVLGALSHGVPLVLAARGFDRAENAQRVVEAGAGVRLDPDALTPEALRAAVRRVLGDPAYRASVRCIQESFARHDGPLEAALLIERLAVTREPVHSPPAVS